MEQLVNWKHGYYADSGYTFGYYPETTPSRLRWAALIQGHNAAERGFRYLDAGCGQGLSLILAAAAHPDSEFVGIDFLPEHIAHATQLAQRCGLTNVRFMEGDFVELARDPSELGQFDYVVCHGITTWIAPPVKAALFALIGRVLKPGGLFYNSYNTFPGWLGSVPFQHLVLLEQRTKTGAQALLAAQGHMERIAGASPGMFNALPGLAVRLKGMEQQDPAYLVQEYNNQFWQPVFVTQMMDAMTSVKLSYLGSATLPEAFESVLSPEVRNVLAGQPEVAVKEQLRDYALNQSFRRDLYVKGQLRPWKLETEALVKGLRFMRNGLVPRPAKGESFQVKAGSLEITGSPDYYAALLDDLESQPDGLSVEELLSRQKEASHRSGLIQALSMLLHSGWILPAKENDQATDSGRRVNRSLITDAAAGAPYKYVALPKAQSAFTLSETEILMLRGLQAQVPESSLAAYVSESLTRMGKALAKDGIPISNSAEQQSMVDLRLREFSQHRLPFLRSVGAI